MLLCVLKCTNTEAFEYGISCSDKGIWTYKATLPDSLVQKNAHGESLSEKIVGEFQNVASFSTYFCI